MSMNSFNSGDYVELKLKNGEIYKGNFREALIEICNIEFDGKCRDMSLMFHQTEIENITLITTEREETDNQNNNNGNCNTIEDTNIPRSNVENDTKSMKITETEFGTFTKMTENYIYITTLGSDFNRALSQLTKSQSIGVVGLGITHDDDKSLSVLVLTNFKEIFIYDILKLKSLDPLRIILESLYITKIVHDGKLLYNHLLNDYHIHMNNIFDTQVADSMISTRDGAGDVTRSLSVCLVHRYNLPQLFDDELIKFDSPVWYERPLTRTDKRLVAYLVVFLRKLRDDLQELWLKDLHKIIQNDYEAYSSKSDLDIVFKKEAVPSTCLEVPQTLCGQDC